VVETDELDDAVWLSSSSLPRTTASTTSTTATKAKVPTIQAMRRRPSARFWALTAASTRAARPAFCRSRFSVPIGGAR
jgi:hypothetical protein